MTRFSIIITSYNQRDFIKDAVNSALCQQSAEDEIIVVDDGSTDGTQEILRQYGEAIRLVCLETNQGHGPAANLGAGLASGEYLAFLDGDDAFLPWALGVYVRIVQTKKPEMILGSMWWFRGPLPAPQPGDTPHDIRTVDYRDFLQRDRPFGLSASVLVVHRRAFESAKGWSMDLWPANDLDLTLRLGDCGRTIQVLAPPTIFRRIHAVNTVKNVPPFITALYRIIHNERAGEYPGGESRRQERWVIIGKHVLYQARRAAKARLFGMGLKLLVRGWPMVWDALTQRLGVAFKGRQPWETIKM